MAFNRNSKADTRLLCTQALDLFVDQSQWAGDLDDQTTYLTSTSTRLAVRSPREISVVASIGTLDTGVILNWGNVAGTVYIYRITIGVGGAVVFGHDSATLATILPPNISGTARNYLIHWSTDYDDFAGTYFSQIAIFDMTGGTAWKHSRVTHTQPPAPAGEQQFNLLGYGAGVSEFSGGLSDIASVRIGCRFHTTTEAREDWITESSTPDTVGVRPEVELAPLSTVFYDADPDTDVGDAVLDPETLAGPAEWLAAVNAAAHRKRLYSPMLNVQPRSSAGLLRATFEPVNFHRDQQGLKWTPQFAWRRPVPRLATAARVWVHVQTYLAGGAPGGSEIEFFLRVWMLPSLPTSVADQKPDGWRAVPIQTCTTNHTSTGVGEWIDLGELSLTGYFKEPQYFLLAYGFGDGTGSSYQRARIKQVVVDPYE